MAENSSEFTKEYLSIKNKLINAIPYNMRIDTDIVHEISQRLDLAFFKFDPSRNTKVNTYISLCFKHAISSQIKKRKSLAHKHAFSTDTVNYYADRIGRKDATPVWEMLEPLSEISRKVVIGKVLENKTFEEIATELYLDRNRVRNLYKNTITRLRKYENFI